MPRSGIRILVFLCLLVILAAGYMAWQQKYSGADVKLAPHRALYQLRMTSIRNSTTIANVSGDMFYEWHQSCDNWTTNQKFHMEFLYPEGDPTILDSTYSTIESRDGKNFHFLTKRERNKQNEEIRGDAMQSDLSKGLAHFVKPEDTQIDLSNKVKFPTRHTIALIEAAMHGDRFFSSPLFDGSEFAPPVDANAFVGKAEAHMPDEKFKDNPLLKSPSHRVRMAFFSNPDKMKKLDDKISKNPAAVLQDENEVPDYEMTLWIHENGVVSEYQIDYPDFSLTASLQALDPLPSECP